MSALTVHVEGIGIVGPGLHDWDHACEVLSGRAAFESAIPKLPPIDVLPAAERRRVGTAVKLAISIGLEAVRRAGVDASRLTTVFSSTGGDCDNCHNILETLASDDRAVSPTRFHNSVHNAPAGYWSIATSCMAPSTSLCAYDATFSAGLLEAATQAHASGERCMLIAFDTLYPEPLYALRPIRYPFGVALVLNPVKTAAARASLAIDLCPVAATPMEDPALEALRLSIPTARSLPLMQHLALGGNASVVIEYLDGIGLSVDVSQ
jgi:hypothetical protein